MVGQEVSGGRDRSAEWGRAKVEGVGGQKEGHAVSQPEDENEQGRRRVVRRTDIFDGGPGSRGESPLTEKALER